MKRFLAFYVGNYYPLGGMQDFIGDFDTFDEALEKINTIHSKNNLEDPELDWNHIYDLELKSITHQNG